MTTVFAVFNYKFPCFLVPVSHDRNKLGIIFFYAEANIKVYSYLAYVNLFEKSDLK